jgi:murein DD-endopeptidase MepM/ murein hydrolase activator NlpD
MRLHPGNAPKKFQVRTSNLLCFWPGILLMTVLAAALAACASPAASSFSTPTPETAVPAPVLASATSPTAPTAVAAVDPTPLPDLEPTLPADAVETAQPTPSAGVLEPSPTASPTPFTCEFDICQTSASFLFSRPIAPPGQDRVDQAYRFGMTQDGLRDPHYGVEFLNGFGTPVLAAADGEVVVAGDDREIFQGPYSYFYGNLVVLRHAAPAFASDVYTLYGHLSEIKVREGETVEAGQEIGLVGMSGVATGSHLHFEVRFGENLYERASNPELWLTPLADGSGVQRGALAGRIVDGNGELILETPIVLEHIQGPGLPPAASYYLATYDEKSLAGQPPFAESFAANDLQPGEYHIRFVQRGMQRVVVQVLPGALTLVTIRLEDW